ncbi:MAG: HypC/HybG/HupF family hydrogenase formation chaperone [Eggerthellaceae bacterium]
MCLAIPAKIIEMKDNHLATVDILGVKRDIALDLTPQAELGDFVLVHAGFAIEVVDPDYAQETIDLIMQFPELAGDDVPQPAETAQSVGAEAVR